MKTSNKLFVAAVALVLGSLATYNAALRAEYRAGNYKKPFYGYQDLALADFSEVAVPAASGFSIRLTRGPFDVHLNEDAAKYVHLTRHGQRLTITAAYPKEVEYLGNHETVIISCPELRQLTTDGAFTVAGRPRKHGGRALIRGFRQDSLTLAVAHDASIILENNVLGQLRATASYGASLELDKTNRIAAADLAIGAECSFDQDCGIARPRYQFAGRVMARFAGAGASGLSTAKGAWPCPAKP